MEEYVLSFLVLSIPMFFFLPDSNIHLTPSISLSLARETSTSETYKGVSSVAEKAAAWQSTQTFCALCVMCLSVMTFLLR